MKHKKERFRLHSLACLFLTLEVPFCGFKCGVASLHSLHHLEGNGRLLFEQIVAMDLEGIVCKRRDSPYKATEKPSRYWIKVKNARYSQLEGREDLFERV